MIGLTGSATYDTTAEQKIIQEEKNSLQIVMVEHDSIGIYNLLLFIVR
jgi:hypothetical protein